MKIDRPGAAIIGAALMVAFRIVGAREALASIDFATITGNPQNMLIGSMSGIPYITFMLSLGPVAVAGLFLSWALLHRISLRGPVDRVAVDQVLQAPEFAPVRLRMKPVVVLAIVL